LARTRTTVFRTRECLACSFTDFARADFHTSPEKPVFEGLVALIEVIARKDKQITEMIYSEKTMTEQKETEDSRTHTIAMTRMQRWRVAACILGLIVAIESAYLSCRLLWSW